MRENGRVWEGGKGQQGGRESETEGSRDREQEWNGEIKGRRRREWQGGRERRERLGRCLTDVWRMGVEGRERREREREDD